MTAPVPSAVRFPDEAALEIAQGCQSVGGTTAQPSTFPMSEIPAGVTAVQGRQEPKRWDRGPAAGAAARNHLTQNRHEVPGTGGKEKWSCAKKYERMEGWVFSK